MLRDETGGEGYRGTGLGDGRGRDCAGGDEDRDEVGVGIIEKLPDDSVSSIDLFMVFFLFSFLFHVCV